MSEGKAGRKVKVDPKKVAGWRQCRGASIAETAKKYGISKRTVINYCREHGEAAKEAREVWRFQREVERIERGLDVDNPGNFLGELKIIKARKEAEGGR